MIYIILNKSKILNKKVNCLLQNSIVEIKKIKYIHNTTIIKKQIQKQGVE